MTCQYASSGCNDPEGECIGLCMNPELRLREAAQQCISYRIGNMGNYSDQAVRLMKLRLAFQSIATPEQVLELLNEIDRLRSDLAKSQGKQ